MTASLNDLSLMTEIQGLEHRFDTTSQTSLNCEFIEIIGDLRNRIHAHEQLYAEQHPYALRFHDLLRRAPILHHFARTNLSDRIHRLYSRVLGACTTRLSTFTKQEYDSAVFEAIRKGYVSSLELLSSHGFFDSTLKNIAMQLAVREGQLKCLEAICKQPLDPFHIQMAILSAAQQGKEECLKFLLTHYPDFSGISRHRAIESAIDQNHFGILQLLLTSQDDLDFAVDTIASKGNYACLSFLLVLTQDKYIMREAVILAASKKGHVSILRFLIPNTIITWQTKEAALDSASPAARKEIEEIFKESVIIDYHYENFKPSTEYQTSFKEIEEDPIKMLHVFAQEGFPKRIKLKDQREGVDLGGISSDCLDKLMRELSRQNLLNIQHLGLPSLDREHAQFRTAFSLLGKLMSQLDKKNSELSTPRVLGPVFHPAFYSILKLVAENERAVLFGKHDNETLIKKVALLLYEQDKNYQSLVAVLMNPEDRAILAEYADIVGEEPDQALCSAQKTVLNYIYPALILFKNCSTLLKQKILVLSADELCESIQGKEASSEDLKKAILADTSRPSPSLLEKLGWIKEKIDSSTSEWRRNFLHKCTAKRSLTLQTRIVISESAIEGMGYHTCSSAMEVPSGAIPKEDFLKALEDSLSEEGYSTA